MGSRDFYDDDDFADLRKKREAGNTRFVLVAGTIVGIVLLLCLISVVGGIIYTYTQSTSAKLAGSWRGQFVLPGEKVDAIYTFNKDGTFREDDVIAGRKRTSVGHWEVRDGQVEIEWDHGGFEIAVPRWIDDNTIEWHIVNHNDVAQIGSKTTLRRQ